MRYPKYSAKSLTASRPSVPKLCAECRGRLTRTAASAVCGELTPLYCPRCRTTRTFDGQLGVTSFADKPQIVHKRGGSK
jgi:hypothetical protein